MKKPIPSYVWQRVAVLLFAVMLLFCAVASPQAEASDFRASYIKELDKSLIDLNTESYYDSDVMFQLPAGVADDEEISVIITMDVTNLMDAYEETDKSVSFADFILESEEAENIQKDARAEKRNILELLDQNGIAYRVGEEYNTLFTGFELLIRAGDVTAARKSVSERATLAVGEEYAPADTQLVNNKIDVYETGIFNGAASGYDGTGMVVAVLDTGIDYAHSAFAVENFHNDPSKLGLTYEDVAKLIGDTTASTLTPGLSASDVFINNKIPYGYDYADKDPDPYSADNTHGTHVSGIICGNDDTITGVAPNAQVIAMKVFSSISSGAKTAWILAALEDCVKLGVDVINMSLGSGCGFTDPDRENLDNGVYEKIRETGISLIVAASNSYSSAMGSTSNGNLPLTSNPDTATVGSPSTYLGALSVASISGVKTPYLMYNNTIIYFTETSTSAAEPNDFFETFLGSESRKEIEFILIPGVGRSADYIGLEEEIKGKIALVRRGDNTFEEKAMIAEKMGAAGIIIYNNVSGDISMNVGEAKLASCSISQDQGEMLAEAGRGILVVAKENTSGPFMSDFSSWGPTPDLKIKPEVTAHGGNIKSAVTGGTYDELSGTSMACPNIAGVALLLRQYVVENFPEIKDDGYAVNAMINRLMMSTADIILGKNGLPYAVRKQGAGLVNITSCINTTAIIKTFDEDGNVMDKTKLELGDDPDKTGVYEMTFAVENFGKNALSYDIAALVQTEGVSETLTTAGQTTVTQEGYVLSGAKLEIVSVSGGTQNGMGLTVAAGQTAKVTVKLTLSDADKKYLDDSFENGMYVEGFITLTATSGTEIDMSVPYLAFYGDWTVAPQLDRDYYETDKYERDELMAPEDKILPDAYSTRPIGGVQGDYIGYLGSYYFVQDEADRQIYAERDKNALSNQEGAIHGLAYIWAGLLRNAKRAVLTITDDVTGEVIYEHVEEDVRKSYGDGGTIRPASIELDFDLLNYNLPNNSTYTARLETFLDYEDDGAEDNRNNVFEFPLTVDFQAPTVEDVEFYYEYDKTAKKNRLYAKVAVYDNHYTMAMSMGYIKKGDDGLLDIVNFEDFLTPVYGTRNGTTYVTYELTDYIYELKANVLNTEDGNDHSNSIVLGCYDYALNFSVFEVGMPDEFEDFYMAGLDLQGNKLELSPNEIYTLAPSVYPDTEWAELLEYTSQRSNVVKVVNNKLVAVAPGESNIVVRDPKTNKKVTFTAKVLAEGEEGYRKLSKTVADDFVLTGYYTERAYYQLSSSEADIGRTENTRFFEGSLSLTMYPSECVRLNYRLEEYFDVELIYESGNEKVATVDEYGRITAVGEGTTSISVTVQHEGKRTTISQSLSVSVKDPYINSGPTLTHYFGLGGVVQVPEDLHLTTIGPYAFSNYDYRDKTEEELAEDDSTTTTPNPLGECTATKVILPEGIERIDSYAFALMTELEEIVLPSSLFDIAYNAFYGCTNLKTITFSGENNLKLVGKSAFQGCDLQTMVINGQESDTLNLSSAYMIGDYAFANNKHLYAVKLPTTLQSIGAYAFQNCQSMTSVEVAAERVKYGVYAFSGCLALKYFPEVKTYLIPEGMFDQCTELTALTIGADVGAINEYAFRGSSVEQFVINEKNTAFKVQTADFILSADGKTLVAIAPTFAGQVNEQSLGGVQITTIGRGAFSHTNHVTTVNLPNVTVVEAFAFANNQDTTAKGVKNVTLGTLTYIGERAFYGSGLTALPTITANTNIGEYAFSKSDLTSVNIPDGVTLPTGVFRECEKLATAVIGNNVTIGAFAFCQEYNGSVYLAQTVIDGKTVYAIKLSLSGFLKSLTIGDNAVIGESAFNGAAALTSVTLGAGATIGKQAFFNCEDLKTIDLSKVVSIGEGAFSGAVTNTFTDSTAETLAISADRTRYLLSYHAAPIETADLSSVTSLGDQAFAWCQNLNTVILNDQITAIPYGAFAQTPALKTIDLSNIVTVGESAFTGSGLTAVNLSKVNTVGKSAFADCASLEQVTLNPAGTELDEYAFSNCSALASVGNLNVVPVIGDYAFAYTAITEADLSGTISLGRGAFMKKKTDVLFQVTLGEGLTTVGDNPFAGSQLAPFCRTESIEFNGRIITKNIYTFDISDTVKVIDGSLYTVAPNGGLVLTTYAGLDLTHAQVADNTVRIGAMAFAYSDVQNVTLAYTVKSVGHMAFYGCEALRVMVFTSFNAPILEEEFDASYYNSLLNIPGAGHYYEYEDENGNTVNIDGNGWIPYFMWNAVGSSYNNIFYGANFVNYVGRVENKLMLVRPSNGQKYETYMYGYYFDIVVDGTAAMDANTLAFMAAVNALPDRITLADQALVEAARAAYSKLTSAEQQGLVPEQLSTLQRAEQRIRALLEDEQPATPSDPADKPTEKEPVPVTTIVLIAVLAVIAVGAGVAEFLLRKKKAVAAEAPAEQVQQAPAESETPAEAEEEAPVETETTDE